ncbi:3-oxoacyl-ACP reductase FabG [Saccharopolyspora taberi]|uniref:Beta-ketoacyl-ACP reductase n=1 Tax=Saccharopolyspora taberi TaxID=60895 RepID=A0ABN3V418_9PSEU
MTRSALVTGGNRGIGLAVARSLAGAGHRVAVTYRTGPAPSGFLAVRCDVTDPDAVDAAFRAAEAEHGPPEIVVSNAGITRDSLLLGMSDADLHAVLDANLVGAARVARRATSGMLRKRWGRLVFLSSIMGFSGSPGQTNYAASKAGLVGLARSLAWELGARGITSNVVLPGLIDTDMITELDPRRRDELVGRTALGRVGTPEEVAAAVGFLTAPEAGFVTGAVVPVTGGLGMGQ